jgi:hypothetical protein
MIKVDGIYKRAILLYNDLRDEDFAFSEYFNDDGFQMLRNVIHTLDSNWQCGSCNGKIVDDNHDSIACDFCFNWVHFKCVGLSKVKASQLKEWFCGNCSKN